MKPNSASYLTLKQLNDELTDFYKYLKANNYTDAEIRKIFAPIAPDIRKAKQFVTVMAASVTLVAILYLATYIETVSWHFSALGRILLIKLLPFWDWTALKNQKCLIEKPSTSTVEDVIFNCDLCENIHQIDVYDDISQDLLKNRYLDVDVPVIVKKSWPKPQTPQHFIDDVIRNEAIATSKPCNLATNIHSGSASVKTVLRKTRIFDAFFVHFQNCDFPAMKQFRGFTPRPAFVPPELSPVQYNWLLWSKNYNVTQFKAVGLVEKVAVVGQMVGGNWVRLVPRRNCEGACPTIDVTLREGESIVFTSLWDLEYRPEWGENLAAIVEMR